VQCPFCDGDSSVTETRVSPDGVRRRRVCGSCKRRFTTYERVSSPGLRVEKRRGHHEPFDADKLMRALTRIGRHRPGLEPAVLRRVVHGVEAALIDGGARSVTWAALVRLVLARLTPIDPVAAQRLRSNYLDEDGRFNLDLDQPAAELPQLGLFEDGD